MKIGSSIGMSVALGLIGAVVAGVPAEAIENRKRLEARISSLYKAEIAGDWSAWYDHISPMTREELGLAEFLEDLEKRDFAVLSATLARVKRLKAPPEVKAAARVSMEVWVRRPNGERERETDQTDYWVLIDDEWYWHWRGWPDD